MTSRRNQTPRRRVLIVLMGLLAVFVLGAMVGVLSKYTQETTEKGKIVSSDFYFTSPMLSETGTDYTLMPAADTIEIPVCNYADDLRYSAQDISYSYSVTKDGTEVSKGSGSITGDRKNTSKIILENLSAGTYIVTATATSPFKAALTGTIKISEEDSDVHYSVSDKESSPYVLLTVWTDHYSGDVTLTWPAGVIPDSTNTQLKSATTYSNSYGAGTVTVPVEAYSSNVYRFFKENPSITYDSQQLTAVKATQ